jgi:dephospho-CoA kinase
MRQIGLTGSIGSGKSTVAALLRQKGIPVLDADVYAREGAVVKEAEICAAFPEVCQGKLDRALLGKLVFANREALSRLEAILHPYVRQRINQELAKLADPPADSLVVLEIPLLLERGWQERLQGVLVVTAPQELRVERVMQRSALTKEQVLDRDASQMPQAQKVKQATWVIQNDSSPEALKEKVEVWLKLVQS